MSVVNINYFGVPFVCRPKPSNDGYTTKRRKKRRSGRKVGREREESYL